MGERENDLLRQLDSVSEDAPAGVGKFDDPRIRQQLRDA
jgi:hypothetical protein